VNLGSLTVTLSIRSWLRFVKEIIIVSRRDYLHAKKALQPVKYRVEKKYGLGNMKAIL
jgi:hypothetical protein